MGRWCVSCHCVCSLLWVLMRGTWRGCTRIYDHGSCGRSTKLTLKKIPSETEYSRNFMALARSFHILRTSTTVAHIEFFKRIFSNYSNFFSDAILLIFSKLGAFNKLHVQYFHGYIIPIFPAKAKITYLGVELGTFEWIYERWWSSLQSYSDIRISEDSKNHRLDSIQKTYKVNLNQNLRFAH